MGIKNTNFYLQMKFAVALVATVAANQYDFMSEDELLSQLASNLSSAQMSEARGDGDAAVAKTAAIKNIQKSLTARILKGLGPQQSPPSHWQPQLLLASSHAPSPKN